MSGIKQSTEDNLKYVISSVNFFLDNIIADIENVDMSTTKQNMMAYILAWKNELLTIKNFTDLDGGKR